MAVTIQSPDYTNHTDHTKHHEQQHNPSTSQSKIMGRDHLVQPPTPDRATRSSFSSIREDNSDLTQTFSSSKVSSLSANHEHAIEDHESRHNMVEARFRPPVTHPDSRLLGYWSPADSFQGWKQINVRGKLASKSFGDLQLLNVAWYPPAGPPRTQRASTPPGDAAFERLPMEMLSSIIRLLVLDVPPNGVDRRNVDLMSLLLTSKTMHAATLSTLYSRITIPHSRIFQKFLTHIAGHPALGTIVRRLDFCHFNPAQLFSTAAERAQARNLTSETLLQCLNLTPHLHEFLAQEYVDDDLDAPVLRKLLWELPRLQALDFCGCSSPGFRDAFTSLLGHEWPAELSITRLSLHRCLTLPSAVFETLLPRLPHLTHLDVAGTRITDRALASIPLTARLSHLNLAKCTLLSAPMVTAFIAGHPAVTTGTLTFLSLATDARSHELFSSEALMELLPILPRSLRSLSLKGSSMSASAHLQQLLPLTKHLEELALGRGLALDEINSLFAPDPTLPVEKQLAWVSHTLHYLDLSDLWTTADLDVGFLLSSKCVLLGPVSEPLEVIELADEVHKRLVRSPAPITRAGWRPSECGSRVWLVRNGPSVDNVKRAGDGYNLSRDDGRRQWKMGAESWGMRKVPVARAEVGGMYGSFMFARKL